MMMARFTVKWTDGPLTFEIPDRNIQTTVRQPELTPHGEPLDLVRKALDHPIGCPPLEEAVRPGDRVAMLITDTKDSLLGPPHNIGPYLVDRLNRIGVPDNRITLIHAAGMHGHAGARERLGAWWQGRIRYIEHHPWKDADLTFLGTTGRGTPVWVNKEVAEADYVFGIGGCHPSLFGYHGGAGIILPGVAGRDTIQHNHAYILVDRPLTCWGPGNPMREDVQDVGDMAGLNMKIDFTANTVFAGYHREEWPVALRYLQEHTMTPVEPADIYVIAPDPSDHLFSLYMKIEMSEQVLHPHGIAIVVVSGVAHPRLPGLSVSEALDHTRLCTDAWMKSSETEKIEPPPGADDGIAKLELMKLPLEQLARIVSKKLGEPRSTTMSWSHKRSILRRRTFLVTSGIDEEDATAFGFAFRTTSFQEALDRALGELGRDARIVVNTPGNGTPLPPQNRV